MDVFVGQKGKSVLKMFKADGTETDSYDKTTGIAYASDNPDSIRIVDDDPETQPKDAEIEVLAPSDGAEIFLRCGFDGDPGDGVRHFEFQAGPYTALEPPDEGVASAEFEVVWEPVV